MTRRPQPDDFTQGTQDTSQDSQMSLALGTPVTRPARLFHVLRERFLAGQGTQSLKDVPRPVEKAVVTFTALLYKETTDSFVAERRVGVNSDVSRLAQWHTQRLSIDCRTLHELGYAPRLEAARPAHSQDLLNDLNRAVWNVFNEELGLYIEPCLLPGDKRMKLSPEITHKLRMAVVT